MTIREVARADVLAALERAVRYRREMAIAADAPAGNIAERIDAVPHGAVRPVGNDGWLEIGVVHDDLVSAVLQVQWHPATDRVRIDRPADPTTEPAPVPVERAGLTVSLGVRREYRANPGYRFFLYGVEHSPEEAARITAERDSLAGWTWRPAGSSRSL